MLAGKTFGNRTAHRRMRCNYARFRNNAHLRIITQKEPADINIFHFESPFNFFVEAVLFSNATAKRSPAQVKIPTKDIITNAKPSRKRNIETIRPQLTRDFIVSPL